jgi:acyl-ACP thioesterase
VSASPVPSELVWQAATQVNPLECDFNQAWKLGHLFHHLAKLAGQHATRLGVGYETMLSQDLFWVLSRLKMRITRLPRAGEVIKVRTWPKTIQNKLFFVRDFEALDAAGERLVGASSAWLIINGASRQLVTRRDFDLPIPELPTLSALDEPLERLRPAAGGEELLRVRAGYSAVDVVGHVNNSRYIDWLCDALPLALFREGQLDWLQINYEREVLPGEEVAILGGPGTADRRRWELSGVNRTTGAPAFQAVVGWKG